MCAGDRPIIVEHLPDTTVVALRGEHDIPTVKAELAAVLASGGKVVVDLSAATFIDSTIFGALFDPARAQGGIAAIAATPGKLPRRLIDLVVLAAQGGHISGLRPQPSPACPTLTTMLDTSHVIPAAAASLVFSVAIGVKGKSLEVPYWKQAIAAVCMGWFCALIGWLA